jgi:hypothetical protein
LLITHKYSPKHQDVDKPTGWIKRWLRRKLRRQFFGNADCRSRAIAEPWPEEEEDPRAPRWTLDLEPIDW